MRCIAMNVLSMLTFQHNPFKYENIGEFGFCLVAKESYEVVGEKRAIVGGRNVPEISNADHMIYIT